MGPRNLQRAAERGFHLIAPFNGGWDAALSAAGRNPADHHMAIMIPVCVAKLSPIVGGALGRVTQLALAFRHPGMGNADTHRSMRLFADEVIPALV